MDKKRNVCRVLLAICMSACVYIAGYLLATALVGSIPALKEMHIMYINAMAMTLAAVAVSMTIRKEEYDIRMGKNPVVVLVAVVLLAYSGSVLFNVLLGSIPWQDMFSEDVTPNEAVFFGIPLWARMLCYEVVAPISEELVFRQVIYKRMRTITPVWVAVMVSALLFGIYHGNLVQGIYAFIMGAVLALVYEWSGSFVAPVLFHMVANHVSDMTYEFEELNNVLYSPYGAVVSAVVFASAGILLFKNKNKCSKNGLHSE